MGHVFSSLRSRQASCLGTESRDQPSIEINGPSEQETVIERSAHIMIQKATNLQHESARSEVIEPSDSGSPGPHSANMHLSPLWPENDGSSTVVSEGLGSGSPRQGSFDQSHPPRSSFAMSDIEIVRHPDTEMPVYRRGSFRGRPHLKIVDEYLIGVLSESGSLSVESPVYEGMFLSTTQIHAPYAALFYSRKKIIDTAQTGAKETQKQAQLLLDFMKKEELAEIWTKSVEIHEGRCRKISFETLWLLYPPGETVFRNAEGGWRAYKVARVETGTHPGEKPIRIFGYYLGFDKTGRFLAPHLELLEIHPYSSEKLVDSLDMIPQWYIEKFMEDVRDLPRELRARGRLYWTYRGKPFYQEYRGDAWSATSSKNHFKVIIDHTTSSRHVIEEQPDRHISPHCSVCLAEALRLGPLFEHPEDMRHDPGVCKKKAESVNFVDADADDHFLYCPSMVWAFSLEHGSWKMVSFNSLHELSPNEESWNRLWIGEEEVKTQLDMMVSAYFNEWEARQDFSHGHGIIEASSPGRIRGRNIHFHGGSGTGKTFTAECLSEKYSRPLYRVACGSIRTDPPVFEQQLRTILARAANWGAILLFENADLFLQEFDLHNLQRNALHSLFVHHLDFSDALVIFATSHDSRLDECFQSRISSHLYFEPLSFGYQKQIWLHLLRGLNLNTTSFSLCEDFVNSTLRNFDDGKHANMNGWQIEKCLGAALALARREDENGRETFDLREHHLRKVLRLGAEFRRHLQNEEQPNWMAIPETANG